MATVTPEIEQKARDIYEKTRRTGFVEQGQPWEPIAEALAEMQAKIDEIHDRANWRRSEADAIRRDALDTASE